MKTYKEVFELIKNGEWHPVDLAIWLDLNKGKSYNQGFNDGYNLCNQDNKELDRSN